MPQVTYGYRGPYLRTTKKLANGLSGSRTFDGARRPLTSTFVNASGDALLDEAHSWSRRNLRTATERRDLGGARQNFFYDAAGRLTQAVKTAGTPPPAPNSEPSPVPGPSPQAYSLGFSYDAAQNLTARSSADSVQLPPTELPTDGSGRNRPASAGGVPLEWDPNGNLTRKGDQCLRYDFRNRLTQVRACTAGEEEEIASYQYDSSNRRVRKSVAGEPPRGIFYSGWQSLEEYVDGQLVERRVFGTGLDEIVHMELGLDGAPGLELDYTPLYDNTGNLVSLTGPDGRQVGAFEYSPFGAQQRGRVDLTPPEVSQVSVSPDGEIAIEFSEEISGQRLDLGESNGPHPPGSGSWRRSPFDGRPEFPGQWPAYLGGSAKRRFHDQHPAGPGGAPGAETPGSHSRNSTGAGDGGDPDHRCGGHGGPLLQPTGGGLRAEFHLAGAGLRGLCPRRHGTSGDSRDRGR